MGNCASVCAGGESSNSSSAPRNLALLQSSQDKEEIINSLKQ